VAALKNEYIGLPAGFAGSLLEFLALAVVFWGEFFGLEVFAFGLGAPSLIDFNFPVLRF
jgi:hypothetical protein